jgi:transcriptional regulator with XRE-family HTH domain
MLYIKFGIGQIIRILREQIGLDQSDLGVDKGTISKIELGQRVPKPETLDKIAAKLRTTPGEIYLTLETLNRKIRMSEANTELVCADHKEQYEMLEEILHSGNEDLVHAINVNLQSLSSSAARRPYSNEGVTSPDSVAPGDKSRSKAGVNNRDPEPEDDSGYGAGFLDARTGKRIGRGKPNH